MENITSKHLVTINLRYGTTAGSLKALAFADLVAKALFLSGGPKTIEELEKGVAVIIGVKNVSKELIEQGLKELRDDKKVKNSNNRWELFESTRKQIEKEIETMDNNLEAMLGRHFPKNIEKKTLVSWFNEAAIDFFEYNGDELVKSVCKNIKNGFLGSRTTEELLQRSIAKYKLETHKQVLEDSFRSFLSSEDPDDQQYLMNLIFAMFSARLVAADVGADPIVVDELKDATFILDTNFLFALVLEEGGLSVSLEALGSALKAIGAKLVFIYETKEEYERVLMGKRAEMAQFFNVYPEEIVIGAQDDFITTAKVRGCTNKEDFERFLQSLQEVPSSVPKGPPIEYRDDRAIDEVVKEAKLDKELKFAIQKFCSSWDPKPESALNHDSALIYVVEKNRIKNKKTFVISLDKGLQACSAARVGAHGTPAVIYLEGLIQILAANNAGPEMNASDFIPLLANIIIKRCTPPKETYTPQDLHWLYSIQKNVADFPPEKIKEIIKVVTKARFAGKNVDDKKLERTINRMYQENIKELDQALIESKERARLAEARSVQEKEMRERREQELLAMKIAEMKRDAKWKLGKQLVWRIPSAGVMSYMVFVLAVLALTSIGEESILSIASAVVFFMILTSGLVRDPIRGYKQNITSAEERAQKILNYKS